MVTYSPRPRAVRGPRSFTPRRLVLGAATLALVILTLGSAASVGATAPAGCVPINYTTCLSNGVYYVNGAPVATIPTADTAPYAAIPGSATVYINGNVANGGYPPNTVLFTYYDPRYGVVSVATDSSGHLIDVNAATGRRVYPIYPDYGYAGDDVGGYYAGGYYGLGCPAGNDACVASYSYYGGN